MTGIDCGSIGPDLHTYWLLPPESSARGPSPGSPRGWPLEHSTMGLHPRAAPPSQSLGGGGFSQNQRVDPGGSWQ